MWDWIQRAWNRVTAPDSQRPRSLWFMPRTDSGVVVTHDSALMHATVWACVRVIAESISQLPWRCMQRTDRGNEILTSHPADRLLYQSPNDMLTPAVWKELVMRDVLTWGNSYHEILFDGRAAPTGLYRISPDRVEPVISGDQMRYRVRNPGADDTWLYSWEVFHVRGLGDDVAGWSVIQHAAQAVGLGVAQDQSMASLIANGSRPAGLITPVGNLSKDAANRIVEEWEATYGGSKNKGKTALLSHAMTYTPLALPNTDAQLLESRKFSILEICRFFRVPPHKVMDLERATFSNIEHQAIEFVQDCLVPWIVKLEQEANRKLVSQANRPKVFTKINVNALLRGDFESRAKGYQMLFDRGVYSINDILELEDRNTIGPNGDIRLVPLNMQTIERALEPPKPPKPPEPPPQDPDDPEDDQPPDDQDGDPEARAAYRPILWNAIDRITARESRMLQSKRDAAWINEGHRGYILDQMVPHAATLSRLTDGTMDLAAWAERRCQQLRCEVASHLAAGGEVSELLRVWSDRLDSTTDEILGGNHVPV